MGFLKIQFVAKYQKNLKGDPLETKKIEKKRKMRILRQSHSAEILERGDPLGFLVLQVAAKYQKNLKRDPLKAKKIEKSRPVPKKN